MDEWLESDQKLTRDMAFSEHTVVITSRGSIGIATCYRSSPRPKIGWKVELASENTSIAKTQSGRIAGGSGVWPFAAHALALGPDGERRLFILLLRVAFSF
jgi:hypothetical protein